MQLVFDAWLLMARGDVSMVDARDAMLAADQIRFGGANQAMLWNVFASRGLGEDAVSAGTEDGDPKPELRLADATKATIAVRAARRRAASAARQLFVGQLRGPRRRRSPTPIPTTPLGSSVELVPGRYELLVRGDGFGTTRLTVDVAAGQTSTLTDERCSPTGRPPRAARRRPATARTWPGSSTTPRPRSGRRSGAPVAGRQVTVRLDPSRPASHVRRVQVSALLRPTIPADPATRARRTAFTALRSFELLACDAAPGATARTTPTSRRSSAARPTRSPRSRRGRARPT